MIHFQRRTNLLFLLVLLIATQRVTADDPRETIEAAIRAAGGRERIQQCGTMRAKVKGTVQLGAAELPFSMSWIWKAPNRFKLVAVLGSGDQQVSLTQAYDGSAGWGSVGTATAPLDAQKIDEVRSQMHLRRVLMLAPLLDNETFQLTKLDDTAAKDANVSRVRVTTTGERDITLSFDQSTELLIEVEHYAFDQATKEYVLQTNQLSDFKVVDGVQFAMKETWSRRGVEVAKLEYTEVSFPAEIDDREFKRPAGGLPSDLPVTRTADVIYGRKHGMALTMDVFTPQSNANGAAVILVVSGGWVSNSEALNHQLIGFFVAEPVRRGYTVFAVFHGSQPKFTIPEVISDIDRAVRFIRHHAREYQIDPNRIGITGGSAGGHLSLMQGTAGTAGKPDAADLVERESSRVQAVACLFPPTDFLNYGTEGHEAFGPQGILAAFRAAADVRELDPMTHRLERPKDEQARRDLAAQISPISHVSEDDPPTLIVHGDADKLVPIQQAHRLVEKLKGAGVRAEVLVRKGRGHDFNGIEKDVSAIVDWFDEHLK